MKSQKISVECLKEDLKNKTLVGEYCGNPNHQHLIKYEKNDILFFAIVDHNSLDSCIPPNQAFAFFKKYSLSTVSIKKCKTVSNFRDLKLLVKEIFDFISQSPIELEGEGSVLYFVKLNGKADEVLSLCQIKTLEYLIFRKLREQLQKPLDKDNKIFRKFNEKTFRDNEYESSFQSFKNYVEELCSNFRTPHRFSYYFEIAENCFRDVSSKPKELNIHEKFLKILTKIKENVEQKHFEEEKQEEEKPKLKDFYEKSSKINEKKKTIELKLNSNSFFPTKNDFLKKI